MHGGVVEEAGIVRWRRQCTALVAGYAGFPSGTARG
jgi:hypothetical protein